MTIAHDSVYTEGVRTDTSDPYTFSHTPGGTLKGVWVTAIHGTDSTDNIVGVTYGGVAMLSVGTDTDTATELGRAYLYFLGHDIPTGTQTVSVDMASATGTDVQFVCGGFTGSTEIEIVDAQTVGEQATNPSLTMLARSRTCLTVGAFYTGLDAPSSATPNGNMTAVLDEDFGVFSARVDKQTSASSSDFTFSYTAATDDCALVVGTFSEVVTLGIRHAGSVTEAVRTDTSDPYTFTHDPAGETLKGVWVSILHGTDSTDNVSGVTYGGVTMTRVGTNSDTVTEPGRSYLYFLGSGIPTGSQTVSVDLASATGTDMQMVCGGFTSANSLDTESVTSGGVSEQASNPSVSLTVGGRYSAAVGGYYTGTAVTSAVPNVNLTPVFTRSSFGAFGVRVDRQTRPSTSDFTFGYTTTSDDVALTVGSFAEVIVAAPATVNATATVGAPIAVGPNVIAVVTVVAATATVGAPSLFATEEAATVAAVATVGAVTFTSTATVGATVVSGVATVGAASLFVTEEATTVAAVATVGAPTVTVGGANADVTPTVVAAVATVGAPSIPGLEEATTVAATATVGSVTFTSTATVDATTVAGTATVGASTPVDSLAKPATVAGVATVGAAEANPLKIAAVKVSATATVGVPIVTGNLLFAVPTVAATVSIPEGIVRELQISATTGLGGLSGAAEATDTRSGWSTTITSPLTTSLVTAGGITVYGTIVAADNVEAEMHVQISTSPVFATILSEGYSAGVDPGEVASVSLSGLVAGTTYYVRARGGHRA